MNTLTSGRIGILGGTFNPVHLGHLILAQNALEMCDLSRILLIPCATPPHKNTTGLLAARHRLAMLQAAVEDDLRMEVSDLEISRGGVSYAIETIAELRRQMPGRDLVFIVGADALPELHLWRDVYSLLALCTLIPFTRPGTPITDLSADRLELDPPWPERLLERLTSGTDVDISSSDIRHRIAEGMSIRYLVPSPVEMYIAEHGLYEQ